jgi:hypothetical protein
LPSWKGTLSAMRMFSKVKSRERNSAGIPEIIAYLVQVRVRVGARVGVGVRG